MIQKQEGVFMVMVVSYLLDTLCSDREVFVGAWTGVSSHFCTGCSDVAHCLIFTPVQHEDFCYSATLYILKPAEPAVS